MFCKLLLPFLTLMNCEGSYLAEGFLHNLCPCFDIVFAPRNHREIGLLKCNNMKVLLNYKSLFKKKGIKEVAVPNIPS